MKSKLFRQIKAAIRDPRSDVEGLYYPGETTAAGLRVNGKSYLFVDGDYQEIPEQTTSGQTIQITPGGKLS